MSLAALSPYFIIRLNARDPRNQLRARIPHGCFRRQEPAGVGVARDLGVLAHDLVIPGVGGGVVHVGHRQHFGIDRILDGLAALIAARSAHG